MHDAEPVPKKTSTMMHSAVQAWPPRIQTVWPDNRPRISQNEPKTPVSAAPCLHGPGPPCVSFHLPIIAAPISLVSRSRPMALRAPFWYASSPPSHIAIAPIDAYRGQRSLPPCFSISPLSLHRHPTFRFRGPSDRRHCPRARAQTRDQSCLPPLSRTFSQPNLIIR